MCQLLTSLLPKIDRNNAGYVFYILTCIGRFNEFYFKSRRAARLRGFEEDLGLQGQQFATLLAVLYAGYITMQIPS